MIETTEMESNNRTTRVVIIASVDQDDEAKLLSFLTPKTPSLTAQVRRRTSQSEDTSSHLEQTTFA